MILHKAKGPLTFMLGLILNIKLLQAMPAMLKSVECALVGK
jgi:hypothetical protein